MAYNRITDLPDVLRRAGIEVVLHDGWRTRGLSTSQRFEPRSLVWHHDASAIGDSPGVPAYMIRNFANAGAQIWVDRAGRWHFVASGRAAHAGRVLPGKPDNYTSVGIETDHTTGEDWPPALLASLRKGSAAIFAHWKVKPEAALHFHKTICDPPGRKVDPDGLALAAEREKVAALMPRKRLFRNTRGKEIDAAADALKRARGTGARRKAIDATLDALRKIPHWKVPR